ncbi:MAG: hypothetical protein A3E01_11810 [Gammaproteobacteria bacterium RIFCSPHIGHO2_12_FULL_63_22]|jgi:MFS family permease|nr:MAG: hypothetical protein A3E01_11810 [Gammaproteobacteria bacterium RIFCSPHIGHO2_12_FULL_63_22]
MSAAQGQASPSAAARRYALLLLFLAYVVNYIDRQIVTILQEPIKADLGLSDTQLGLMTGLSFALFYATLGIPIARIADRHSRTRLIAGAITLWSAMTAACAAAGNFWTLLMLRMGVGVGEAGLSPPAHSLISDYYEPERRATAIGIYSVGIQVGVFLGFLAGGVINHFFGWRMAFLVVGLPGLLLALLIRFTMREPPRGQFDPPADRAGAPGNEGLFASLAALWRIRPFRYAAFASGFHALVLYGHGHWAPPYLGRLHAMPLHEIAFWLAILAVLPGALGIWLSGIAADWLVRRSPKGRLWVASGSLALLIPFEIAYALAGSPGLALAMSAITHFLGGAYLAPTIAFAHSQVTPRQRASASAVLLLGLNLIGLGIGPMLVGLLSDAATAQGFGTAGLRYALLAIIPSQFVALALFLRANAIDAPPLPSSKE